MTDREPMPKPLDALERSLRQGPADEAGYRAEAIDFSTDARPSMGLARRSRGLSPVFSFASTLAILLVVVVGAFAVLQRAGQAGASPSPSALPSRAASPIPVPAFTETYVSPRNGFAVGYPSGWSTTAATTTWRPGTYVPIGSTALDELKPPGTARLEVASQRLAAGQTEATWIASFVQPFDLGFCTGDRASWPRVAVDGQLGYLDVEACPAAVDTRFSTPDLRFDVIVFSGDRVYEIAMDGVVDRAYFEAILATVHLDPTSALDPPEAS